jgi:arsenical pump membrane protein
MARLSARQSSLSAKERHSPDVRRWIGEVSHGVGPAALSILPMLGFAIFVATLILVIWQPRGLGIGWSALGGAAVALAAGVVGWADVGTVWHIVWDATFTFVALIIISLILDEAGFFAWAALHVARWGGGDGRRLFPLVVLLGAVIAAFFANDGAALLALWLYFRRDIPERYAAAELEPPQSAITDSAVFRAAFPLLGLLLVAYFATAPLGIPIAVVTGAAALVLMAIAGRWLAGGRGAVVPLAKVLREAPWQIVLFSIGMYLVVYGLGNAGLTQIAAGVLVWLADKGTFVATVGTGFVVAALASLMNNMPATLVGALAIDRAGVELLTKELMLYANVIGNDLGPKFTPIGSLATLLWLHVLAGKGRTISWGQYMKVGLVITPPVLLATLVALWLWLPVIS